MLAESRAPAARIIPAHRHGRRSEVLAFGALALFLLLAHVAFLRQDAAPPVWDEALHLLQAARFEDFLRAPSRSTFDALRAAWDFYPPLFHALVGALSSLLGSTALAARLVNLAWLAVLGWGTHRAGAVLFGRAVGAVSAALVVTFPIVTQLSRMAITDFGLAAMAAASVGFLLASDLRSRRSAVGFGLLLGAGQLTKWLFPAYVAGPVMVWAWARARDHADNWRLLARLGLAAAVATAVAGPWYLANAGTIITRGLYLVFLGPALGNPHGWNWANVVVYAGVILDVFVTAPERLVLIGAGAAAVVYLSGGFRPARQGLAVVAAWLIVPYVTLTAISSKDPRYVLPLVAPLAVLCAWGLLALPHRILRVTALVLTFGYVAGLFILAVSGEARRAWLLSGLSGAPRLQAAVARDLRNAQRPANPGWPSAEIVSAIHQRLTPVAPFASLAVVPDLATVNPNTLAWLARGQGFRLDAHHPRDAAEVDAESWEYVLLKPEGDQGENHTTEASAAITARVLADGDAFSPVQDFTGPEREVLRLLRTRASVPPWTCGHTRSISPRRRRDGISARGGRCRKRLGAGPSGAKRWSARSWSLAAPTAWRSSCCLFPACRARRW